MKRDGQQDRPRAREADGLIPNLSSANDQLFMAENCPETPRGDQMHTSSFAIQLFGVLMIHGFLVSQLVGS